MTNDKNPEIQEEAVLATVDNTLAPIESGHTITDVVAGMSPEQFGQTLTLCDSALSTVNNLSAASKDIVRSFTELMRVEKELDTLVEGHRINAEMSVEKLKQKIPIAEKTLDRTHDRIDKAMDHLMSIPTQDNPVLERQRDRLLTIVMKKSEQVENMMMQLLMS